MTREQESDHSGMVAPPPLIYAAPLGLGLALGRVLPGKLLPEPARVLGWPLLGAGVALIAWFVLTLRAARTPLDPREPVTTLVSSGPYRLTRNPAYLGMAMIYAGVALLANALWAALLLPGALLAIRRGVIDREERYLERRFGDEYVRYRSRVRRWV